MGSKGGNYASYKENQEAADGQIKSEYDAGYLDWSQSRYTLECSFGELVLSKMGCLVSEKDGRVKIRLIHDLRRSLVNSQVIVEERLVLPRLSDLIRDVLDLLDLLEKGESVELFGGDFKDAFKQLFVHADERRFLSGEALGGFFIYATILFGIGSGPLTWGRVAAATMRLTQGALDRKRARLQCFVDDPILVVRGTKKVRDATISFIILFWSVLGLKFAYSRPNTENECLG